MNRTIIIIAILMLTSISASVQKWHLGTDFGTWAHLGTMNIEGGAAVSRHFSIEAAAMYNPWVFKKGNGSQFQSKRQEYLIGTRWWPWHVYSGWWVGGAAKYREYNRGGLFRQTTEEGDAVGLGISGGYTLMLNEHLNIEFGLGAFGGWTRYTSYTCPKCGRITDSGDKWFILPDDLTIALIWVF